MLAIFAQGCVSKAPVSETKAVKVNKNIGVVILHGMRDPTKWINPLLKQFKKSKITVVAPEMTWSEGRGYDCSFNDSVAEIDKAISQLKKGGASKIFLGGHSTGASAAAAYAVNNHELSGLILIAPGHTNAMEEFESKLASNIALAKEMISAGKNNKKQRFQIFLCLDVAKIFSIAKNAYRSIRTTPEIYLSHFDPDYKDMLPENIKKIGKKTAILMIVGSKDSWAKENAEDILNAASNNPQNKYLEISGGHHLNTPDKGKKEIVTWIEAISTSI